MTFTASIDAPLQGTLRGLDIHEWRAAPAAFRSALAIAARQWEVGNLTFVMPSGQTVDIAGRTPGPHARLVIHDYRFFGRVMASADIGFGEGYMAGEWDTPDLQTLLEAFTFNFDHLERLADGNPIARLAHFLSHLGNRNSKSGSRRNILAHYDLGNAFYALPRS